MSNFFGWLGPFTMKSEWESCDNFSLSFSFAVQKTLSNLNKSLKNVAVWKNNFEDLFSREINIQYFLIQHVFVCVNVCVREFEWEYFVWKRKCVCVLYEYVYACVWESKSDWEYCVWGSMCFVSTYVYVWVLSCLYVHVSVCVYECVCDQSWLKLDVIWIHFEKWKKKPRHKTSIQDDFLLLTVYLIVKLIYLMIS